MDNQLPKILSEGDTLFIPKGVYHRVIKGNGKLVILIKENENR
jgi:quercetin dioxygenase-like cupin family protein